MGSFPVPLSILDLATVGKGETVAESFAASVDLAQRAEKWGFTRIWYAEHHNMPTIASSATSVLIAHIASQTTSIRLGSGGIMLPNHSPLVIAEQFGTLATLHPGRIDLGLGRAPGTDQVTVQALRRTPGAAESFPNDVLELQGFLGDHSRVRGVAATPGRGTHVPLYILGSSLYGAQLAAALGLPYSFASHFAPDALHQAISVYRERFEPSDQLAEPYVIVGAGTLAADSEDEAERQRQNTRRARFRMLFGRGQNMTDAEVDQHLDGAGGMQVDHMMTYTGVGTGPQVRQFLLRLQEDTKADELILTSNAVERPALLRSFELVAEECL
ncbi:LLM class flavin-dependent oxidoreductase [Blastococcus sp. Marseille-P5729]|uniref:LLM class flavin-dependent oxidoreductase n=1 Tax=Blastococcus sp. Marseille-P5729 TaxID=2086582 RepID=UPI000D0F0F4C|nr:LLM class flavin-dependent oxidoreductase [Blastococcus sp. Marseille-P5729]